MKKLKTGEELLGESFLCKAELKRLLGLSTDGTRVVYDRAIKLDAEKGRDYEAPKKVSMESILAVTHLSYDLLVKQTKMRMRQHPQS